MKKLNGSNIIACKESKKGKSVFNSINPKTLEKSKISFTDSTKDEIVSAAVEAKKAFEKVKKFETEKIALFLEKTSDEILNLGDQLIDIADWETSLGFARLNNERARTCNQLKMFANYIREGSYVNAIIDNSESDRKTNPKPDIRRMLIPIGPVAVFSASNFPFAFGVCGGDTASAWAAGCPVIVKGHPSHPQTSELFARAILDAIEKCGFPPGWFSLIQGKNRKVSEELILHPEIEAVGFTGSRDVGRSIFNLASSRKKPIPLFAEMGSINPVFITKGALAKRLENLAIELSNSITLGAGQFCTKPGILIVPDHPNTNKLIEKVSDNLSKKQIDILLNENVKKNLEKCVRKTLKIADVTLKTGGKSVKDQISFNPTVIVVKSDEFIEESDLQKEHFGPVGIFVICQDNLSFTKIAEKIEGQLTATINLEKDEYCEIIPLISTLKEKAGRIIINGVPTGVEVCNAMQHGGPYPATTSVHTTSVGMEAIKRFLRPVAFQNFPDVLLPIELKNENSKKIMRIVNGSYSRKTIQSS